MRKLSETEINEIRSRCAGLQYNDALIAGGRWLAEHHILHWTGSDVEEVLFGNSKKNRIKH